MQAHGLSAATGIPGCGEGMGTQLTKVAPFQVAWVQSLPLPLVSCVTLGKSLNLSVPLFSWISVSMGRVKEKDGPNTQQSMCSLPRVGHDFHL